MGKLGKQPVQTDLLVGTGVWAAFGHTLPLVARFLARPELGLVSLKVVYRGQYDFLAVAKKHNDDGSLDVLFGSGPDFVGSLLGLESAMDMDKWRKDKPWKG